MQVPSLGWEDPLEKEMAIHVNILVRRLSWAEEPGGLQSIGLQRVGHEWAQTHAGPILETGGVRCIDPLKLQNCSSMGSFSRWQWCYLLWEPQNMLVLLL